MQYQESTDKKQEPTDKKQESRDKNQVQAQATGTDNILYLSVKVEIGNLTLFKNSSHTFAYMIQLDAKKWVNDYGDMLFRYALPRVNDREIAKDLVQETFLAAWRNYENFKGEISEKNWLFTILKNKIIDHFRKSSTRLTDSLPEVAEDDRYFENDHWTSVSAPRDWKTDTESVIDRKEFYEVLSKCKGMLKEIQNTVFTLKYIDGLESDDICKELNITSSNYWVLIHRAKLQLRACLAKNWFLK